MFNKERPFQASPKTLDERMAARIKNLKVRREQGELAKKDHTKLKDAR